MPLGLGFASVLLGPHLASFVGVLRSLPQKVAVVTAGIKRSCLGKCSDDLKGLEKLG